jgi:hypothetical protein
VKFGGTGKRRLFYGMTSYRMCKLALISLLVPLQPLFAQQKFERESRLDVDKVPALALAFIDSLTLDSKVYWYLEEGLESKSIEAKFEYQEKKVSAEFDTLGVLEDVEVEIRWETLPVAFKDSLEEVFNAECSDFDVRKIQIQYSGTPSAVLKRLQQSPEEEACTTRYEVVMKCRTSDEVALYEYLFDDKGGRLSRSKIVFNNSSNLEY